MGRITVRLSLNSREQAEPSSRRIPLVVLIVLCPLLINCATAKNKPKLEAPPPSPIAQVDQPQEMAKLPPPDLNSVQEAVKRVFKDSALVDTNREPVFVAGDFNGDLSQDLAVVLKPAPEKVSALNEEFPNWILRDLSGPNQPGSPRLSVATNDILLAVIHGYGPNGWRDAQATQTYLLKNAVGSNMAARHPKDVTDLGKQKPRLRGDVIAEVVGGQSGYLYYAGASYVWYDPKTFKGDIAPGMFHGAADKKVKK